MLVILIQAEKKWEENLEEAVRKRQRTSAAY